MRYKYTYRGVLLVLLFAILTCAYIYQDYLKDRASRMDASLQMVDGNDYEPTKKSNSDNLASEVFTDLDTKVIPSGEPVGIYVKTAGVMVIDSGNIRTCDGGVYSPAYNVLMQGDYITAIDGIKVKDKATLIEIVKKSGGKELELEIYRNGETIYRSIKPVMNLEGDYMLGIWVKDDIAGIGTLTFIKDRNFYALGHSINDNDTGLQFLISEGAIYNTNLMSIKKPEINKPGRLEGYIDYKGENIVGIINGNSAIGISGVITDDYKRKIENQDEVYIMPKQEVHEGDVTLVSSISGKKENYKAKITKINRKADNKRCLEIKITDDKLIALTGGIVQGMSGTPILQDGKLVGAITHVFVEDSTKGYGIFIEDMLEK